MSAAPDPRQFYTERLPDQFNRALEAQENRLMNPVAFFPEPRAS